MNTEKGNRRVFNDFAFLPYLLNTYQQVAGNAIFEIGRRLKHVKESDLVHGEFGKWLETIEIDRTLATRLMKISTEIGDSEYATSHKLGIEALYQIATLPEESRTNPHTFDDGTVKTPDEMTVRELRQVKRELKEVQEESERLRVEANKPPEVVRVEPDDYAETKAENVRFLLLRSLKVSYIAPNYEPASRY